jgi:chromosome segregation ATPase
MSSRTQTQTRARSVPIGVHSNPFHSAEFRKLEAEIKRLEAEIKRLETAKKDADSRCVANDVSLGNLLRQLKATQSIVKDKTKQLDVANRRLERALIRSRGNAVANKP